MRLRNPILWSAAVLTAGLLAGCVHPIRAERAPVRRVYQDITRNSIRGALNDETRVVLRRYELGSQTVDRPADVLRRLHQLACTDGRRDVLFALSELNYAYAEDLARNDEVLLEREARDYFLASAVYAYLYLLGDGAEPPPSPFDRRFRIACDLYNNALARGLAMAGFEDGRVAVASEQRRLPGGALPVEISYLSWPVDDFDRFLPANFFRVRGLTVRNRQAGLGAPLIGVSRPQPQMPVARRVPMTAFLRIEGGIREWTDGKAAASLELHWGYDEGFVRVNGRMIPLETDNTVSIAHTLNENLVWQLGAAQFLSSREIAKSDIYLTQPYEAGRIPVVFVHGTFSSPVWWAEMWNTLRGDSTLRQRCQFWYFIYNSGNPVTFSAARLREAIAAKVKECDPEGKDPALKQMVVIGHSQGGLLTRMCVVDPGTKLLEAAIGTDDVDKIGFSPAQAAAIKRNFVFEPLTPVTRVVYISTPHRGRFLARGWVRQMASKVVRASRDVLVATDEMRRHREKLNLPRSVRLSVPTSLDGMSPDNPVLKTLVELPTAPGVKSHSVIAVMGEGEPAAGDDGVVKFASAKLEGVESELIVRSPHSCQQRPVVIEEIRRILLEHLSAIAAEKPRQ